MIALSWEKERHIAQIEVTDEVLPHFFYRDRFNKELYASDFSLDEDLKNHSRLQFLSKFCEED